MVPPESRVPAQDPSGNSSRVPVPPPPSSLTAPGLTVATAASTAPGSQPPRSNPSLLIENFHSIYPVPRVLSLFFPCKRGLLLNRLWAHFRLSLVACLGVWPRGSNIFANTITKGGHTKYRLLPFCFENWCISYFMYIFPVFSVCVLIKRPKNKYGWLLKL